MDYIFIMFHIITPKPSKNIRSSGTFSNYLIYTWFDASLVCSISYVSAYHECSLIHPRFTNIFTTFYLRYSCILPKDFLQKYKIL